MHAAVQPRACISPPASKTHVQVESIQYHSAPGPRAVIVLGALTWRGACQKSISDHEKSLDYLKQKIDLPKMVKFASSTSTKLGTAGRF